MSILVFVVILMKNLTTNEVVNLLNDQYEQIKKLEESVEILTEQLAQGVEFVMGDIE